MYCPKCGKQNVDDARFCAGCGAVLNEVQAQAAPAQPVQPQPMEQPPQPIMAGEQPVAQPQPVVQAVPMQQPQPTAQAAPVKKKKTGFKVFLAILVVLLLVGVGVVSFMFISKASHDRKVKDQLALAEQYLDELQYEEAIAAYMAVLDLEPASEDAADGLTDTYIKWAESCAADGDYDKALEILQNADDRASSKKIKKQVSEIEAQQEAYQEQLRIEQEQREEEERQRLAEEAREKAGETLQNYLDATLISTYGLLDCNAIYMADYQIDEEYDWSAWSKRIEETRAILMYDIRDYDGDGQAEMLVAVGKLSDSYLGEERGNVDMWLQMYEAEEYTVYMSAEQNLGLWVSGDPDAMDLNAYLMYDGTYNHIALDSQAYYGLVADGVSYYTMLWRYDGDRFVQEINFATSGSDFDSGEFDSIADSFEGYGLYASAEKARGNGDWWGMPAYDEEGDHLERLFRVCARNPYLYGYTAFENEGGSLWWGDGELAGLGYIYYGFENKDGGSADEVDAAYGPQ